MAELTGEERGLLKAAAYGAVLLVSNADPGIVKLVRESRAASRVFVDSTGLVRGLLVDGAVPRLPTGSPERVQQEVLPALSRAVRVLAVKAPDEVENYRRTVLETVYRVAGAAAGVHPEEAAMVERVRRALADDAGGADDGSGAPPGDG